MSFRFSVVMNGLLGLVLVPFVANAAVLEEVVVTAQKREQNLQDVGISVTAFTGRQLRQLGYTNAQEVSALAPGVSTIQPNGPSTYALSIRGVAQNDLVSNQESPVSIYVDEVYVSQMAGAGFLLFDMERLEILRGPQGTLFGRNATGGLAHFVTRKPSQEMEGYAQVTGGSYEQIKFEGAIGGGISETLAGRVSIATHHNSGYVENRLLNQDINNANDYAGRVQLLFEPNDDVEFLFNARGALQQIRTGFFENVPSIPDATGVLGVNDPTGTNFNGYRDDDGDVFAGDYDKIGAQDMESYGFTGSLKWNIGGMQLTSITDFSHVFRDYFEDSDASPFADFNFFQFTDADQFSQEIRLSGESEQQRWVAGFYYLDIDVSDANGAETPLLGVAALFGLPPGGLTDGSGVLPTTEGDGTFQGNDNPYTTKTKSWSIFGQIEYDFNEKLTGIAGFRWIEEEKKHVYDNNFVDFQPGMRQRNGNPNILFNAGTYSGKYDEGLWSARVELDYHFNEDVLLYASWNRGVKGGGFNAPLDITDTTGTSPTGFIPLDDALMAFGEEELDAFEVGFKATMMDGLARLNGSAFYYDYNDYQAFRIIGLSTFIFNADAKAKGFELELQTSPVEGLDFLFGIGFVDVDIKNADLAIGLGPQDTKPVQSPKWNLNGLLRYEWPAFNGNLAVQGDFHYRSKHFFSLTKAPASTEDGYAVANARMSYTTSDEKWGLSVFVNNLTDEEYLVQTFDLATVLGMTEQYYGLPRWIGGSVSYNF
jgi:iron complex outermembrane recepter protein